jgi:hypothetical protein
MPKPTKEADEVVKVVDTTTTNNNNNNAPPKERPYRDYSQETETPLSRHGGVVDETTGGAILASPPNLPNLASVGALLLLSNTTTGHNGFPVKLYDALLALDAAGMSHIACFQPHGRSFRVLQPQQFVTSVLSTYEPKLLSRLVYLYYYQQITQTISLSILADGSTNPSLLRFSAN